MKLKFAVILTAFVCTVSVLPSCSGERENRDLYLLEELESASAISDPEERVERLGLYIDAHNSHPYRISAYVKIIETIAADLNDFDRAMNLFEEFLSKETEPSARGELLYRKFAIPSLREKLLATGDAYLEEGNNWGDTIWGTVNGRGQNHLGRLLMEVRDAIRKGASDD